MFSAIILAGGKSERMGKDKAFLNLGRRTFISMISQEMLRVSDEVIVVIGRKDAAPFKKEIRDGRVRFVNDSHYIENPLGGMLTGFEAATNKYAAVVACDLPLIRNELIGKIFAEAEGHDAAVPIWNPEDKLSIEPLCAVYNAKKMKKAIKDSLGKGVFGCRLVVRSLSDVRYFPVSELRGYDPDLLFLNNINTRKDYLGLLEKYSFRVLSSQAMKKQTVLS